MMRKIHFVYLTRVEDDAFHIIKDDLSACKYLPHTHGII